MVFSCGQISAHLVIKSINLYLERFILLIYGIFCSLTALHEISESVYMLTTPKMATFTLLQ